MTKDRSFILTSRQKGFLPPPAGKPTPCPIHPNKIHWQRARVSNRIPLGMVDTEASWWFPEMPGEEPCSHGLWESNANVPTLDDPDGCDRLTGACQYRTLLCRTYKA